MSNSIGYVTSDMGKQLLADGDYLFRKQSVYKDKSYWICTKDKEFRCKAKIRIVDKSYPPKVLAQTGEHNHSATTGGLEARLSINMMKQKALLSPQAPSTILANTLAQEPISLQGALAIGPTNLVKRRIARIRRKNASVHGFHAATVDLLSLHQQNTGVSHLNGIPAILSDMKKKAAETNDSPSEIYAKTMAEDRPPLGAMTANGTKLTSHVDRCLSVIRRAKKRSAAQKLNASLPISADRPSMVVDDPTVKRDGAGNAVPPKRFIQLGIPIASESSPGSIAPVNSHRLSIPALPADGSVVYDDHMSDKENNPIHCSGVMSSMYALQKAARFCDFFVTLLPSSYNGLTEREVFSVHKVVFGALSPRICALEKNDIKIGGNITCFGLNKVIEYAYTGNLGAIKTMSHDQVTQVSTAASALDVPMKDYIRQNRPDVMSTVAKIVVNHRETSSQSLPRSLEHHEESFAGPSGGRLKAIGGQPVTKEVIKSEPQDQSTDELAFSMFGVSSESMATDGLEALPRHPESVNGLSNNMLLGPPASVDYGSTSSAHSSKQFPVCKTNIPVSLSSSTLASGSARLEKEQSTANLWTPENISRSADRAGDAGCSKSDPDNLKNSIPVFDDSMFTS